MRLCALLAAIAGTAALIFAFTLEAAAHTNLVSDAVTTIMAVGVVVAWIAFFCAHCRDSIQAHAERQTARIVATINTAVDEAGARCATEARIDTLASLAPSVVRQPTRLGPVP
jgi:ABC-type uncharacterized transport system permease subunit